MELSLGSLIVIGADGRWHPGIGDPTPVGWLTVVAYFAACLTSWRAARLAWTAAGALGPQAPEAAHEERLLAFLWSSCALAMLILGLNKQLDLQSWLTQIARDMAHSEGWYEERRIVQVLFILGIGAAGFFGTAALVYLLRRVRQRAMATVVGLGVIVSFVVIRAASFHHFDLLINARILSFRMNWILELTGIALVGIATYRAARRYMGQRPSS